MIGLGNSLYISRLRINSGLYLDGIGHGAEVRSLMYVQDRSIHYCFYLGLIWSGLVVSVIENTPSLMLPAICLSNPYHTKTRLVSRRALTQSTEYSLLKKRHPVHKKIFTSNASFDTNLHI